MAGTCLFTCMLITQLDSYAKLLATMSAQPSQVVDTIEFISVDDYTFSGDNRTVENKRTFVDWYRRKASIFHAAAAAKVARSTIYKWMEDDYQFACAVRDSFEDAADVMESSAYEEALGVDGRQGNALLKMFWLKAHRPKFRDRVNIDLDALRGEIKSKIDSVLQERQVSAIDTSTVDTSATSPHDTPLKSIIEQALMRQRD